jgi:hypothetical protein
MTTAKFTTSITGCARCHGDGHPDLTFSPLTHPVVLLGDLELTHWAACPVNGEPILAARGTAETLGRLGGA